MKPSGIEWIGDIPDDWEVRKLLSLFKEHKDRNKNLEEQNLLSLSYGKIKRKDINNNDGLLPASFETYNIVEKGDIVFRLTDLQNDKRSLRTGIVTQRGIITSAYVTIRPKIKLDSRFYHYLYHMYDICKVFYGMGDGVRQGMGFEDLKNIPTLIPPLKTQQKIADYLDEKCGEIDATIAKQKEIIEKLKAYKQSLISETVTKGLDKSAPLKPSGIEWIGDIPAHWEVCKIKNHCNLKTGSTPSSKDLSMFDGTENWFTPSDFTENYMLKNSLRRLNAKVFDQNLVPIFPPLSVLIVGIGATTGKVGFTTSKSSSNQQITAIIPKNKNIFPKFLLFWMIANTKMIRETALFTTLPILNNDTLGNATLLIPPYKEQLELASYIENKNIEIDVIINKKQNIIQKLDTYKKSLIFECVTGKTDL